MTATPEQGLARAQLNHLLEQLVDDLPDSHRSVFVLREIEQLSTAEVAELLGITADNVKQRLSRAKATLRNTLEVRTGATLAELYPFEAPRCDRVVAGVLARLPDRH
jgi:RNA polymerase sigma-70 factor (ECF subfamily)